MVKKRKFDVKLHWKSRKHEWSKLKRTVLAEGFQDAWDQVEAEVKKPWRWDYQGGVKPHDQYNPNW